MRKTPDRPDMPAHFLQHFLGTHDISAAPAEFFRVERSRVC
jgi:hypothetical protein